MDANCLRGVAGEVDGLLITHARPSWLGYAGVVGGVHLLGLIALFAAGTAHPVLFGLGFLAYTLGLRHAFDADHIAAIDNIVRKLAQQQRNPLGVGFYFSLGHSTVVLVMALAAGVIARWGEGAVPHLQQLGGVLATTVSGAFLIAIGFINLVIWTDVLLIFRSIRQAHPGGTGEHLLLSGGIVVRLARPLFRLVNRSWHVYAIGFLFGLSFDTATEIALLALSAGAATSALSPAGILALPLLFTAGMSLMDTADGVFMTTAYRWAFNTPLRKVFYNLTVTGLSVVAALVIGVTELTQALSHELRLTTGFWGWFQNVDFGTVGYAMVGLFVLTLSLSFGIWKALRIEERSRAATDP